MFELSGQTPLFLQLVDTIWSRNITPATVNCKISISYECGERGFPLRLQISGREKPRWGHMPLRLEGGLRMTVAEEVVLAICPLLWHIPLMNMAPCNHLRSCPARLPHGWLNLCQFYEYTCDILPSSWLDFKISSVVNGEVILRVEVKDWFRSGCCGGHWCKRDMDYYFELVCVVADVMFY